MKLSLIFLVGILIVTTLYVDESEAWRIRIRFRRFVRRVGRAIRRVVSKACPVYCASRCSTKWAIVCSPVCKRLCRLGKRDQIFEDYKPFPADFAVYDSNKNGAISLDEFANAINSKPKLSKQAFALADDNSDGQIDEKEFDDAPFITSDDYFREPEDTGIYPPADDKEQLDAQE